MKRIPLLALALVLIVSVALLLPGCVEQTTSTPTPAATATPAPTAVPPLPAEGRLKVATTTSLYDTGLWGYLEPMFEDKYDVQLDVLYAGTGKAIDWGQRGDVDVITVHDKDAEEKFIADGYGVARVQFAYNYFLIVGPPSDPAAVKDMAPEAAFAQMMAKGNATPDLVKFVSRGDNSGTHSKEKAIWAAAGYKYDDVRNSGPWYVEAGGGMGPTLVMANEMQAYTLSDIGTFLAFKGDLNLVPIVDKGDILLNVYSVIVVKKTTNRAMADNMVAFLTSPEIQDLIGKYGVAQYAGQLFTPCAGTTCGATAQ